jgi:quercetin dioxygenase-like cupin family protein
MVIPVVRHDGLRGIVPKLFGGGEKMIQRPPGNPRAQSFPGGDGMKSIQIVIGVVLGVGIGLSIAGSRALSAQDPLKMGKILQRTELSGAKGMEAILVLRELPPGGESGKHTQSGNEVVYILEGSVTLELEGKPAQTVKTGEAFTTAAGEVHNVRNASKSAPGKALAFYIAKKGTSLENLSVPAK